MIVLDVVQVALATIAVMVGLQVITFFVVRMFQPPEPKVVQVQAPPAVQAPPMAPVTAPPPAFIQNPHEEIKLPEYEPRQPASNSLRMDPELPAGLQETRPPGT